MMKIEHAGYKDCLSVARLHSTSIHGGFLSTLGIDFLELLYCAIVKSSSSFCLVAKKDDEIAGFISGTVNIRSFYREFIIANAFKSAVILLPHMLNIKVLVKIIETLFYPSKNFVSIPRAELLSIAVVKHHRGGDVSRVLFNSLVDEFRKQGLHSFKAVVGEGLISASKFYEKTGGVLESTVEIHKGETSRIYVWQI